MAEGDIDTYYEDGQWKSKVEGKKRAFDVGGKKVEQAAAGRERAVREGVEHVIKKKDGTIGEKNTYPRSRDKNPPKG